MKFNKQIRTQPPNPLRELWEWGSTRKKISIKRFRDLRREIESD